MCALSFELLICVAITVVLISTATVAAAIVAAFAANFAKAAHLCPPPSPRRFVFFIFVQCTSGTYFTGRASLSRGYQRGICHISYAGGGRSSCWKRLSAYATIVQDSYRHRHEKMVIMGCGAVRCAHCLPASVKSSRAEVNLGVRGSSNRGGSEHEHKRPTKSGKPTMRVGKK